MSGVTKVSAGEMTMAYVQSACIYMACRISLAIDIEYVHDLMLSIVTWHVFISIQYIRNFTA